MKTNNAAHIAEPFMRFYAEKSAAAACSLAAADHRAYEDGKFASAEFLAALAQAEARCIAFDGLLDFAQAFIRTYRNGNVSNAGARDVCGHLAELAEEVIAKATGNAP